MKSCPKCNRTFPDEGQKFCTFDGGLLIAPQTFDPNATIRATSIDLNAASERPTSRDLPDPNATIIENYPATVALPRNTGPTTGPTPTSGTSDFSRPPATPPPAPPPPPVTAAPPPPAPPPPVETAAPSTVEVPPPAPPQTASAPSAPLPPGAAAQKKSKMPLIIGGVLLFLLLGAGLLVGAFFLFVKPRLDEMQAQERDVQTNDNRDVSTPTPVPSVEAPSPTPEDTYAPPSDTTQFVNSNANLDGRLAEHYVDFSFYYPDSWKRDPKAGVAGATNFVKVDKILPPDFTQENFAVGWYTSTGTFAGDLDNFSARVKQFSNALSKGFPNYKFISESPTKVNTMDAYEFRWEGLAKGTDEGDVKLWGRVIFLPTGKEGDTTGLTLSMLGTSLAPDLSSIADVGERGESPVILESFRFGKKQ